MFFKCKAFFSQVDCRFKVLKGVNWSFVYDLSCSLIGGCQEVMIEFKNQEV